MLEIKSVAIDKADFEGNTALHYAVQNEHVKITYCLLMKNANPNIKNKSGKIPGQIAIDEKNDVILHLFVF